MHTSLLRVDSGQFFKYPQARSPRPPSSVEALLQSHGLQHFADQLIANGYDDLHFLPEVAEAELIEIGITQAADREKVREGRGGWGEGGRDGGGGCQQNKGP